MFKQMLVFVLLVGFVACEMPPPGAPDKFPGDPHPEIRRRRETCVAGCEKHQKSCEEGEFPTDKSLCQSLADECKASCPSAKRKRGSCDSAHCWCDDITGQCGCVPVGCPCKRKNGKEC